MVVKLVCWDLVFAEPKKWETKLFENEMKQTLDN